MSFRDVVKESERVESIIVNARPQGSSIASGMAAALRSTEDVWLRMTLVKNRISLLLLHLQGTAPAEQTALLANVIGPTVFPSVDDRELILALVYARCAHDMQYYGHTNQLAHVIHALQLSPIASPKRYNADSLSYAGSFGEEEGHEIPWLRGALRLLDAIVFLGDPSASDPVKTAWNRELNNVIAGEQRRAILVLATQPTAAAVARGSRAPLMPAAAAGIVASFLDHKAANYAKSKRADALWQESVDAVERGEPRAHEAEYRKRNYLDLFDRDEIELRAPAMRLSRAVEQSREVRYLARSAEAERARARAAARDPED